MDLTIVKRENILQTSCQHRAAMQGARVSRQWGTDETYKILDKTRQTAVVFWQQEDREEVKMKVSETLEHRFPSSQS